PDCEPSNQCEESGRFCTGGGQCPAGTCSGGKLDGNACNPDGTIIFCEVFGGTCTREACIPQESGTCDRDICELPVVTKCARTAVLCDPTTGCPSRCTGGEQDRNVCTSNLDCSEQVCMNAGTSCASSFDCPGICLEGTNSGLPCDLDAGATECPLGACTVGEACVTVVSGTCDPDTCDVEQTQCVQTITVLPECQASTATPEQIGSDVSTKNRFLSFTAGDASSTQGIRVTFDSLPPPYDLWNGAELWVGPTSQVTEAGANVVPTKGFPNFTAARLRCTPF
ncbi:MAG: hypothetical protein IH989_07230, partial [Planctomycetes bacterium]|nr:hypothetical protein [Planctomycetota bacterium]